MFKKEIRITAITAITAIMAIMAIILTSGMVHAKDMLIQQEVSRIIDKVDKNGSPFRILVVKVPKVLNGVAYLSSMPIMAFSDTIDLTDGITEGSMPKLVVNINQYMGRDNAVLRAVVSE